ncbi:MAG: transglutaminase domain-containing protein [Deltaproteobacteria bacterium]|nr:transglutaminase domain-containing protein [Deltaproteobacteria bacterium]
MKPLALACLLAVACAPALAAAPGPAKPAAAHGASTSTATQVPVARDPVPLILSVPRPKGGEWMGLYVLGKKAGWAFADLREGEYGGQKAVVATSRVTLKANVGGASMQRDVLDERYYEFRDGGRLLGLRQEKHGDGGEEILIARCTPEAVELKRVRPGLPDEIRKLPPTAETVEHADAPRIVASTRKPLSGVSLDLERTLADKKDLTEVVGEETVTAAGVSVKVVRIKTVEEDSTLPIISIIALDGRQLELQFGEVMVGKAESEQVAKKLDQVDIFNLTRVVLAKPLPEAIREPPSTIVWKVHGLGQDSKIPIGRQQLKRQGDDSALLTISTRLPKASAQRPVSPGDDQELADNLKANLAVESDSPTIIAKAKEIVGDEKNAWAASKRVIGFVHRHLEKTYGSSSDRATDVLALKRGDCTEHALLATALLRAAGIPARRVDGLVYMQAADGVPALYWHEWVEAWVGEWVEMDPTFNQPVADPSHVALGTEARVDTAGLIGKLKFEPVEIKPAVTTPAKKK